MGLRFEARLATRPKDVLGVSTEWDEAEAELRRALVESGITFVEDVGGGAFYAPKIDIAIFDCHDRAHQCGTIQADFQLPQRFGLKYIGRDGKEYRPVMVHRAILGSLERFIAILTEHTAGRWPLWLSPRQVVVCTVADRHAEYAHAVAAALRADGLYVDVDDSAERLPQKVRGAQTSQYNYIVVVGDRDMAGSVVTARTRDGTVLPPMPVADLRRRLREQIERFG